MFEVRERLRWDGSIDEPLHEDDFEPIVARIVEEQIKAVAVCFVHAYVNPTHELAARRILKEVLPNLSITLSHEVAREWLSRAGKRWRPFLTACAYRAWQEDPSTPLPPALKRWPSEEERLPSPHMLLSFSP